MMRQGSIDETNINQYSKISNYEDTVRQLDIYYGIGIFFLFRLSRLNKAI